MEFFDASMPKAPATSGPSVASFQEKPTATLSKTITDGLIGRNIMRCVDAYTTDGIVRQAIDIYTDHCTRFDIGGRQEVVDALVNRLTEICLCSGTTWDMFKYEVAHELFKTGTSPVIKIRDTDPKMKAKVKRALFKDRPNGISRLAVISALQLTPSKQKNRHVGWFIRGINLDDVKAYLGKTYNSTSNRDYKFKMDYNGWTPDSKTFINRQDISIAVFKKDPSTVYGIGLVMPVLDDLTNLKIAENLTVAMIKKHALPLSHYTIDRPKDPLQARMALTVEQEIARAKANIENARPDSILVTPAWHNIKLIGSESHALRVNDYLGYLQKRVISGLGIPSYYLGLDNTSTLSADKSALGFYQNMASSQKILENFFNHEIFFELLWEMGYDPYSKKEDRVFLRFHQTDGELLHKHESHVADLFTKGLIDLIEARERIDIDSPIRLNKTFQKLYSKEMTPEKKDPTPGRPKRGEDNTEFSNLGSRLESTILNLNSTSMDIYSLLEDMGFEVDHKIIETLLSEREVLLEFLRERING